MSKVLIKVENLKKQFQNEEVITKVLYGLDFEIEKGEFIQYAVQRCSSCGKLFYSESAREDIYELKGVYENTTNKNST